MTTRTRTPASHTGTAEVDLDDETVLLVDDPATWPKGQRAVRTLVAMPAYNEEAYIAKTVVGAARHADAVLVVDDGSTDETVPIAGALGAIVVCHETNKGYGGALQTIFSTARDLGAEELVIIDSDGQHDPAAIPRLLASSGRGTTSSGPGEACRPPRAGLGPTGKRRSRRSWPAATAFDAGVLIADPGLKVAGVRSGSAAAEPRYRGKRIAVVVPAYNEEDLIGEVLDGIPDYVAKVYVVDDGSADMTGAIIEDYAHLDPRFVAIHHNPNRGVGAAITTGYLQAVEDGMDIAAVMAGDNQMDPAYLPDLLDPIVDGRADYTKGNRLINQAYRKGMSRRGGVSATPSSPSSPRSPRATGR
jgi:glycosyltransferase involved in cell wall biosynthesis